MAMLITNKRRPSGFTLIEVMIVVAIIGILASVAYPSYQQYVIRSNRAAAQAQMMEIANRQTQYFLANRSYADLDTLGFTLPSEVTRHYGCAATPGSGNPPSFTITCTPVTGSRQATDGVLTLNSQGTKSPAEKW